MQFLHTMIRVHDLDAALDFFCDGLGLEIVRRVDHDAGRFSLVFLGSEQDISAAALDKDGSPLRAGLPLLELTYNWPEEGKDEESGAGEVYSGGRNFGHVAYQCDDIYALCQHLMDKGVTINRPPRDGYMAFVRSPDGISVELLQKGERKTPIAPWKDMENIGEW